VQKTSFAQKLSNMKFIAIVSALLLSMTAYGQNGSIKGSIIDDKTGEALIGATIVVENTTNGTVTDLDGKFVLPNLAPGLYNVSVSFISYSTTTIKDVEVKAGEATILNNIRLSEEVLETDEVVITAEAIKSAESALLTVQRKSSIVLDGISSEQFSRNNDSDAASAIRRVTGVSVEGGKYVVVRGLGDRYNKNSINNAEIPSLDPDKNAVQMDLFPSNLLDNIIVYKTFSPELPGSFSGGYIDISTKEFPENFTLQASASIGVNTNATFNDQFLSSERGNTFWLGMDDGTYAIPDILENQNVPFPSNNLAEARELDAATKSFDTGFGNVRRTAPVNHSFSLSLGDERTFLGRPLGFVAALSYNRSYSYYDQGATGRYFLPGADTEELVVLQEFEDSNGTESVLWGGLLNLTSKVTNNSKIGLNFMFNQSADLNSRFLTGVFPADANDPVNDRLQNRAMQYLERSLMSTQIRGEHLIGSKLKAEWTVAYTKSTQDEPDLRFFNNVINTANEDTVYFTLVNPTGNPTRFYRDLEEDNLEGKLDFELPFKYKQEFDSKFKFGGGYLVKNRSFNERLIEYNRGSNTQDYTGDPAEYFGDDNIGLVSESPIRYGLYIIETPDVGNSYTGDQSLPFGYAMVDWGLTQKFRLAIGARYERTDIQLNNTSPFLPDSLQQANLVTNDVLPSINLIYELQEGMNLRVSYGRTVGRPTFRELSAFTSFNFLGDARQTGNPDLRRTVIDNFDIRWEYYANRLDYFSASFFYKDFTDPIERTASPFINEPKDGLSFFFRNVPQAVAYGAEFEIRKGLSFIAPELTNFRVGVNFSYIISNVDINEQELALIRVNDPSAEDTRPMYGQSPYLINALLSYDNPDNQWNVSATYNVIGERLFLVASNGTPNIYEQPRNLLNVNIKKGWGPRFSTRLSIQNILDAPVSFTQEFKGREYDYQRQTLGTDISLNLSYLIE
jgi:outer membrane receptor protein involved in Fe transport